MDSQYFEDIMLDTSLREAFTAWESRQSDEITAEGAVRYPMSERQARRMKRLLRSEALRIITRRSFSAARKIAAAVVVSAAVLFSLLMATPQGRAAAVDVLMTWYEKFVSIVSPMEEEAAPDPSEWSVGFVPEGFALTDDELFGSQRIIFYAADEKYFSITITPPGSRVDIGVEGTEPEQTERNGVTYYCFSLDDNENAVYWDTENTEFVLSGNLPTEELLRVAEETKK
ncbi:hypothetical protein FACS189425_01120 [Clostridia bacterium]|nr:hypothetical protein FACS189425_01120 [Clostridia bacterium]